MGNLIGILSKGNGGSPAVIEEKTITENGTYTAPEGVDGYNPIIVNVPQREPVTTRLEVTENGTYSAPEGVDGYNPIIVNVPIPETNEIVLFENGAFNQDTPFTFTLNEAIIVNNKLHCEGVDAGFVVMKTNTSEVGGGGFFIKVEMDETTSNGQVGQGTRSGVLPDLVLQGANRISYETLTPLISCVLMSYSKEQGVFFACHGAAYNTSGTCDITKITAYAPANVRGL